MIRKTAFVVLALLACLGSTTVASAAEPAARQLEFGVQMAKKGLWNEAVFRFQRALDAEPRNGRVLNNLAVAYEAVGNFEKALETYRLALEASPGDKDLRSNYSQFLEFYQSFEPADEEGEADVPPSAGADGGEDG